MALTDKYGKTRSALSYLVTAKAAGVPVTDTWGGKSLVYSHRCERPWRYLFPKLKIWSFCGNPRVVRWFPQQPIPIGQSVPRTVSVEMMYLVWNSRMSRCGNWGYCGRKPAIAMIPCLVVNLIKYAIVLFLLLHASTSSAKSKKKNIILRSCCRNNHLQVNERMPRDNHP